MNAIFDEYQQSSGSGQETLLSGIAVTDVATIIPAEMFVVDDKSDGSVVLSVSKADGCDINTETTIQPQNTQSTALVVNNSSGVALAMVSEATGLLTSKPIGMIVNNNKLLNHIH